MINMKKHELGDTVDFDEDALLDESRFLPKAMSPSGLDSQNLSEN